MIGGGGRSLRGTRERKGEVAGGVAAWRRGRAGGGEAVVAPQPSPRVLSRSPAAAGCALAGEGGREGGCEDGREGGCEGGRAGVRAAGRL